MKNTVTTWCLVYAVSSLIAFWIISIIQAVKTRQAKDLAKEAKDKSAVDSFDAGKVLEGAAKLVDAFTKGGPGIASLGASIVALALAAYIVTQSPKDQDSAKSDTKQTTQTSSVPKKS